MKRRKYLSILCLILFLSVFNCSGKSKIFKDDDQIIQSIKERNMEKFKAFLKKYKINARNEKGQTLLMLSSQWKRKDFVKHLLESGAKVNLQDKEGNTALVFAIEFRRDENAELLLEYGANVKLEPKHKSLFKLSCRTARIDLMKNLIDKGLDYRYKDENGKNGIMFVIESIKDTDVIEYFIELGIDVNEKDNNGDTALLMVTRGPNPNDYIKLLLKHGADPNIVDKNGKTALDNIYDITADYFISSPLLIEAGGKRAKDL